MSGSCFETVTEIFVADVGGHGWVVVLEGWRTHVPGASAGVVECFLEANTPLAFIIPLVKFGQRGRISYGVTHVP